MTPEQRADLSERIDSVRLLPKVDTRRAEFMDATSAETTETLNVLVEQYNRLVGIVRDLINEA